MSISLAPKYSNKLVNCNSFNKMKVSPPTQVLGRTAAAVMFSIENFKLL